MNKRIFGMLVGVVGSAVGVWFWNRQRLAARNVPQTAPARDHGTVIFHNTPRPLESDVI